MISVTPHERGNPWLWKRVYEISLEGYGFFHDICTSLSRNRPMQPYGIREAADGSRSRKYKPYDRTYEPSFDHGVWMRYILHLVTFVIIQLRGASCKPSVLILFPIIWRIRACHNVISFEGAKSTEKNIQYLLLQPPRSNHQAVRAKRPPQFRRTGVSSPKIYFTTLLFPWMTCDVNEIVRCDFKGRVQGQIHFASLFSLKRVIWKGLRYKLAFLGVILMAQNR